MDILLLEFDEPIIRVCQFHVIQAIGRADFYGEIEGVSKRSSRRGNKKKRVAVSLEARSDMCKAFRRVQRYRGKNGEKFDTYRARFESEIEAICTKHLIQDAKESILTYFEHSWFSDYWRRKCISE